MGVWRRRQVQIRRQNFDLLAKHSSFVQHLLKAALNSRDTVETLGSCTIVWDDPAPLESSRPVQQLQCHATWARIQRRFGYLQNVRSSIKFCCERW